MTHYPPSEDLLQEAFSKGFEQVRRRCVTAESERDAAVAENARLLARIAAVEAAIPAILMPIEMLRHGFDCTMRLAMYDGARCVCSLRAQISERVEAELLAALAASPTPTGPETATCERDAVFDLCDCEVPGPAIPEPTTKWPRCTWPDCAETMCRFGPSRYCPDAPAGPGGADPKEARP